MCVCAGTRQRHRRGVCVCVMLSRVDVVARMGIVQAPSLLPLLPRSDAKGAVRTSPSALAPLNVCQPRTLSTGGRHRCGLVLGCVRAGLFRHCDGLLHSAHYLCQTACASQGHGVSAGRAGNVPPSSRASRRTRLPPTHTHPRVARFPLDPHTHLTRQPLSHTSPSDAVASDTHILPP